MPKGRFDGNTTYDVAYIPSIGQRGAQFKPETNLKIGGKF